MPGLEPTLLSVRMHMDGESTSRGCPVHVELTERARLVTQKEPGLELWSVSSTHAALLLNVGRCSTQQTGEFLNVSSIEPLIRGTDLLMFQSLTQTPKYFSCLEDTLLGL